MYFRRYGGGSKLCAFIFGLFSRYLIPRAGGNPSQDHPCKNPRKKRKNIRYQLRQDHFLELWYFYHYQHSGLQTFAIKKTSFRWF